MAASFDPLTLGVVLVLMAFFAEYIDSTLGMGYGTTLTPILLLMGFEPLQVVPAVLLSELFTGLLAAGAHHYAGNANFMPSGSFRRELSSITLNKDFFITIRRILPRHLKIALVLGFCSIFGTVGAVLLAVRLDPAIAKIYIGTLVFVVGIFILIARSKERPFSIRRIVGLGLLASFNKGISGGGYGPVVTGGQILAGVDGKNAVAITSLAEGLTCIVGFGLYLFTRSIADFTIMPYLCAGAVLSVPLSAISVKYISTNKLKVVIGIVTTALGLLTLGKLVWQG